MARNVEIKVRLPGAAAAADVLARATTLADGPPEHLEQHDSFYRAAHGRLKLRRFVDGSAELIHYQRADGTGARLSDYVRVPVPAASVAALHEALTRAHGSAGELVKQRTLLHVGQTRVHLDAVQGLGPFVELEVVLHDTQSTDDGAAVAEALLAQLGLAGAERIACAYVDLL